MPTMQGGSDVPKRDGPNVVVKLAFAVSSTGCDRDG